MKIVIGIDEVGRGPIAGPVAVAAFRFTAPNMMRAARAFGVPIRDSKKLTRAQRELWYEQVCVWQKEGKCDFSVVMVSAKTIDTIGIAPSIRRALAASLKNVSAEAEHQILLDGGLRAPEGFVRQTTIIKGDESEPVISFASIVAKVTRDRHMFRQHKKYPAYGFDAHVGYGTRGHYEAIRRYGVTPVHRNSFLKSSR